jgi:ATP-dependent protease HslVU (ClpYQ) peptidase subunit
MTTVAVNKTMMAADRQFTYRDQKLLGRTKIYELNQLAETFGAKKVFLGFAGSAEQIAKAIGWFYEPNGKFPKLGNLEAVALTDRGQIWHSQSLADWVEITQPYFAIGSGCSYAVAAMAAGSTPMQAVKIAAKFDVYTGMAYNKLEMK